MHAWAPSRINSCYQFVLQMQRSVEEPDESRGHNVKRSLASVKRQTRENRVRFVHCQFSEWNALIRNLACNSFLHFQIMIR
jgi:hypothetical protein